MDTFCGAATSKQTLVALCNCGLAALGEQLRPEQLMVAAAHVVHLFAHHYAQDGRQLHTTSEQTLLPIN